MHHSRHRSSRRLVGAWSAGTGLVFAALLILAAGAAVAAPRSAAAPGLVAGTQPRGLAPEGSARAALKPRVMDSALDRLAGIAGAEGAAAARGFAAAHRLDVRRGRVAVIVFGRDAGSASLALARRAIRVAGGTVEASYGDMTSARVPPAGLIALAESPGVVRVRLTGGVGPDEVVSVGVAEMAATAWTAAGFDGTGVKVGIIDAGFKGYQALLGTELPAQVTTWGQSALGPEGGPNDTQSHGTAVAEVIHDSAPGAELFFATVDDPVEFGLIERWMAAQGVTVINHSMTWWGWGQNDGTGVINDVVNKAVADGMFWANSAANSRRMHWMGDFTDPDGDFWLDWDGVAGHRYNTFLASKGKYIQEALWWDDAWTAASQDFDLFLDQWDTATGTWKRLASSTNAQRGQPGQTPFEQITLNAPAQGLYALEVSRAWSTRTDVDFDLWSSSVRIDQPENAQPHYFDYGRTFAQPADNPSAGFMAAAAIERAPTYAQASYSSQGPTRDGRVVPEIAGPTDVAGVSIPLFGGTSSAAPHVAGVAAVVRQAYPSFTAAQVEEFIKTHAVDLGVAGPDTLFGWGRILMPVVPKDTTRPVTVAFPASVKKGGLATLNFRVNDAGFSAGPATVTIVVKNGKKKAVKTIGKLTGQRMCRPLSCTFTCTLPKGSYKFYVGATDAAGNKAGKVGSAKLAVK